MSMIERVAAFLKDRDESVAPHEVDDDERIGSAREIIRLILNDGQSVDLGEMLRAIGEESLRLEAGVTMSMTLEPRPKGVCMACGSKETQKGRPLMARYCSPECRKAGPARRAALPA